VDLQNEERTHLWMSSAIAMNPEYCRSASFRKLDRRAYVDAQRFAEVQSKLRRHYRDAQIWKDACLLYFQQFNRLPIPIYERVNDLKI